MEKDLAPFLTDRTVTLNHLLNDLPSLPGIVRNLQTLINDRDVNFAAVARNIESDQALTAKILRLANSPFYGLARKISSVGEGLAVLGLDAVHQLILTTTIVDTFKEGTGRLKIEDFWTHSFAVGTIARHLMAGKNEEYANEAFVGGILHDIGRLLFIRLDRNIFDWLYFERNAVASPVEEVIHFGISHQQVGQLIAEKWNFPEVLKNIVSGHHGGADDDKDGFLIAAINIADIISHAMGFGSSGNLYISEFHPEMWSRLNLNAEKCEIIIRRSLEDIFEGRENIINR